MNEILKQRLVGALILVALGVIFWPIIFVQPEPEVVEGQRSIPAAPSISEDSIVEPDGAGLRASPELAAAAEPEVVQPVDVVAEESPSPAREGAEALDPTPPVKERAPRSAPPQELAMDSDGVPVAWTLQVATLSSADKADALRRKLLDMNYKAYVAEVRRDGKTLHRVCVGPQFERADLERLKPGIDEAFGVKSLVARYIP